MKDSKRYRALTGLSYPANEREAAKHRRGERCEYREVERGEVVADIPARSLAWLLAGGHIEKVAE